MKGCGLHMEMEMSSSREIRKFRRDINSLLNLTCEIYGTEYMTTFHRIHYCSDCIIELEKELEDGIEQ